MLHSMTGFARESAESGIGTLTWELRAVNHRYLDVQFKLPEDLRSKEQAFRQQASGSLGRGKVECAFYFRRAFNEDNELQIDMDLVGLIGHRISDVCQDGSPCASAHSTRELVMPSDVWVHCPPRSWRAPMTTIIDGKAFADRM